MNGTGTSPGPVTPRPVLCRFGRWACYGFALGAVAVALLVTYSVEPLREQPPTLLFFAAVVLTSWYAGLRAGLVASVLAMLALDIVFVKPAFSLRMALVEDGSDFLAFAAATWLVNHVQDRWRRTHHQLVSVEEEVKIAQRIQQRFFPARAPSLDGFEIAGSCFPAGRTGGDFFDYLSMAGGRLAITVGDVSGHGLGPAIVMVLLRAYLRALALTYSEPEEILTAANRLLAADTDDDWFATVFLVQLDPGLGRMLYAAAGHECYLLDGAGPVIRLESTGMPLGVSASAKIGQCGTVEWRPGQILLLLSDGIVECHSAGGESFGLAKVVETASAHREKRANEIVAAIYQAARAHRGTLAQEDDMTIVVVKAI